MWDRINRSIEIFDLYYLFSGKNVHEQAELFNKMLLNVFHNFIPNKVIICDDKDPPCINQVVTKPKNWLGGKPGYFSVKEILTTLIMLFWILLHNL